MSAHPPFDLLVGAQAASVIAALIPVRQAAIGNDIVQAVSARELHAYLKVGKLFAAWVQERIAQYNFVEHQDYEVFSDFGNNPAGGRPAKEYTITLDMAKELAMVERNAKGKEARQYFIECERRALAPAAADPLAGLPPEQRALIAVMVDNANIKARQDEQAQVQAAHAAALTTVENRVDEIAAGQVLLTRPSAAESIVHIRQRIGKLYGLPARIVDEVVRQSPYALKPVMVKNAHEDAMGGSYACFWIKDVSAVFVRFVAECRHVTDTQAVHPYIKGRFKLARPTDRPPSSAEPLGPQAGLNF